MRSLILSVCAMRACSVGATLFIVYTQDLRFTQWTANNEDIVSLVKTQLIQFFLATELDRKSQINMETLMLTDHLPASCQCFKELSFWIAEMSLQKLHYWITKGKHSPHQVQTQGRNQWKSLSKHVAVAFNGIICEGKLAVNTFEFTPGFSLQNKPQSFTARVKAKPFHFHQTEFALVEASL